MNFYNPPPLTAEEEFRGMGIAMLQAQIEQSKAYILKAREDIVSANKTIEVQTQRIEHYTYILSEIEKAQS